MRRLPGGSESRKRKGGREEIKVLQGNMNGSSIAHDLLTQYAAEWGVGVLLLSEQYRNRDGPSWISNDAGTAAIWVPSHAIAERGVGTDYVWVRVGDVTFVSVYLSPNVTASVYASKIDELEDFLRDVNGPIVMGGDFNARAVEWGMPTTNRRGRLVMDMSARLEMLVLNDGTTPTYRRPGFGYSIPDITFATDTLTGAIGNWHVTEEYTGSDHQYIILDVIRTRNGYDRVRRPAKWNVKRLDRAKLEEVLRATVNPSEGLPTELAGREKAEDLVGRTTDVIAGMCDKSMPRTIQGNGRRPAYWWTDEIATLRRDCLRKRRKAQRARNGRNEADRSAEYKMARKALRVAIARSKTRKWNELCTDIDRDPWGAGYKIALRRVRGMRPSVPMNAELTERVVDGLFPDHPLTLWETPVVRPNEIPPFTNEELKRAVSRMKCGKAPGLDGIPTEVIRVVASARPEILLEMYNLCLTEGVFSSRWKKARLVLLDKNKGDANSPGSYRPLCLLDTLGKTAEMLIRSRLAKVVRDAGDLSPNQHGFRERRSTIGAIREVVRAVDVADEACHAARPLVLLATLDVRNAFNSARWPDIVGSLEGFGVPAYMRKIVQDYFRDRLLVYDTDLGRKTRRVTAGVAQGSILGPDFWNAMYDGLLRLQMPEGVYLVGYADDVAIVIIARNAAQAQLKLTTAMLLVLRWMREHGLELALAKTEIVLLTRKRVPTVIPMTVASVEVMTKPTAKYLGVTLDTKLKYGAHLKTVAKKALTRVNDLGRLMANVRGPRPATRRLLMATTHSILLYGAEVWADVMKFKKYRKCVTAVQRRGALRIACSYRTVSEAAVLVIAGVIPVDLLACERKRIYDRSPAIGRALAASEERERTILDWQDRWTTGLQGRWTRRLIVTLKPWLERGHGEVGFYLTQFLSGHGYFRRYLNRMNKVETPGCTYCGHDDDDAEHTFFVCPRWTTLRETVTETVGPIAPDSIIETMLRSSANWDAVAVFVETILRAKREDQCLAD